MATLLTAINLFLTIITFILKVRLDGEVSFKTAVIEFKEKGLY